MENSVVGIAVTDSPTDVCGAADQRDSVYATAAESCDVVGTACGDTVTEVGGAAVQCDPVETAAAESRDVVETACGDTVAEVQSAVVAGDPCYPSHPVDTMVAVSEGLSASHTLLIEKHVDSHTQWTADGAIASHARSKPVRRRVAEPLLWKKTQRKRKRNSGQAYINAVGKLVSAKSMQVVNCTKCRFHCSENFSEEK